MLDIRFVRENAEMVRQALRNRGRVYDLDSLLSLDAEWRSLVEKSNQLKHERNVVSLQIPKIGEKAEKNKKIEEMRAIADKISSLDSNIREIEMKRDEMLLTLPNIPHSSVPVGEGEKSNLIIREGGKVPKFGFKPKTHWELGEELDIIDFERGAKIAGSGFYVLKGLGAMLERALINFMLDLHNKQGYKEIFPTVMVNEESAASSAHLAFFKEDMYCIEQERLWLNPTAEVPLMSLHRNEIFDAKDLPIYYTAYLPSFRKEAGKHAETRGIARVHQFNKVELIKIVRPETSYEELESMLKDAEEVVKKLELPYRVKLLCTGDMGLLAAKTYDIDVYAPGMDSWLEVSSCSNCTDFQARRAGIKFRAKPHLKSEFVHSLNGSGIALPRTVAAILENYQNKDGSITIPKVLRPYLAGMNKIGAKKQ